MALKVRGAAAPAPERDTHFDIVMKKDGPTVRATTHDGKKYLLVTFTANGAKLRQRNNHPNLGVRTDRNGAVAVI